MVSMIFGFVVAFSLRWQCARYLVYFATVFFTVRFLNDVAGLVMTDDWLSRLAMAKFFLVRPIVIGALILLSVSLSSTIRFERKYVPSGVTVLERRQTRANAN